MSISYYDLLDVAPDATHDEIRTAWRSAVADLDPTDRRFAVYNEAAGVLLDPERRAAYDEKRAAELEAETSEGEAPAGEAAAAVAAPVHDETAGAAAGASAAAAGAKPSRAERRIEKQARRKARRDATAGAGASTSAAGASASGGRGSGVAARLRAVPVWALAALGAVLVALVAVSVYLAVAVPADDEVAEATRDAQSAAERAIVPVLSYDYRSLEADGEAAREWMTDDYQEKYDQLFSQIQESAPETKTVVRTEVVASGLVRSGEERVQVLVFVDRPTRNKALDQPVVYKDQVRVTMEKVGDRWLVDQLCTTASCES